MSDLFAREALPGFERTRAEFLAKARRVALQLGKKGRAVTINDVRVLCPPPENIDPRIMGAVFRTQDWDRLDYVSTNRRACHGRPVAVFVRRDLT